jgi:hypothetical protein
MPSNNPWIKKLKVFNGLPDHPLPVWAIPRKGTAERAMLDAGQRFHYLLKSYKPSLEIKEEEPEHKKEDNKEDKKNYDFIDIIEPKPVEIDKFAEFLDSWIEEGKKINANNVFYIGKDIWTNLIIIESLETNKNIGFITNTFQDDKSFYLNLQKSTGKTYVNGIPDAKIIRELANDIKLHLALKKDLVMMPFSRVGHANLLIYRWKDNLIEHYEPHGSAFERDEAQQINYSNKIIKPFIKELSYLVPELKTVNIKTPNWITPALKGFQEVEGNQAKAIPNFDIQTYHKQIGGFCLLWVVLFMESVIAYPKLTSKEVFEKVNKKLEDKGEYAFFNIMVGYTKRIQEILNKLFKNYTLKDISVSAHSKKNRDIYVKFNVEVAKYIEKHVEEYRDSLEKEASSKGIDTSFYTTIIEKPKKYLINNAVDLNFLINIAQGLSKERQEFKDRFRHYLTTINKPKKVLTFSSEEVDLLTNLLLESDFVPKSYKVAEEIIKEWLINIYGENCLDTT